MEGEEKRESRDNGKERERWGKGREGGTGQTPANRRENTKRKIAVASRGAWGVRTMDRGQPVNLAEQWCPRRLGHERTLAQEGSPV